MLIFLLAMPSLSIQGASNGLLLWFNVVLPTLAPFMICTHLITMFGGMELLMKPFAPLFRRFFGLTSSGGYVLLCGLLCGYPLGARLCANFYSRGQITRQEAQYLLSICNHPSPMFLLGYVKSQLSMDIPAFLVPLCLYLPVLPLSLISRRFYYTGITVQDSRHCEKVHTASSSHSYEMDTQESDPLRISVEEILMSTCDTLVVIGGYIMLFSILTAWISVIPVLPLKIKALLSGLAEITTGVHQICSCGEFSSPLFPVVAAISFGGLSGIFQTKSVIRVTSADTKTSSGNAKNAGLSIRHYLIWKLLHMSLSCIMLLLQPVLLP